MAVIGAGNIAGGYDEKKKKSDRGIYTHAGAYKATGKFKLSTIFDLQQDRAESLRSVWGFGKAVTDFVEICSNFHDVVSVCTPDQTHFSIVKSLLEAECCHTIFVEKPLAESLAEIEHLIDLASAKSINLVVNFQRRYETIHQEIRQRINASPGDLLSAGGYYIKGLKHIGVTMVDTITYLCGYPEAVQTFNRVFNGEVNDFTYEFVLFFPEFSIVVKTVDSARHVYNYHLFEIDMLFTDQRLTIVDNSQGLRETNVGDYAYSGIRVLKDRDTTYRETSYKLSMLAAAEYLYDITYNQSPHTINIGQNSYDDFLIIEKIIESYNLNQTKLYLEPTSWKK